MQSHSTEVTNKIGHSSRSSSIQRILGMLNNFEKFCFPSIEKRWTKDKETDGQKEKKKKKKKRKKEKENKQKRKKENKRKKEKEDRNRKDKKDKR